jgi:hypothetical protein
MSAKLQGTGRAGTVDASGIRHEPCSDDAVVAPRQAGTFADDIAHKIGAYEDTLTEEQKGQLMATLLKYEDVLRAKSLGQVNDAAYDIQVPPWETPIKVNDRRWSVKEVSQIKDEVDKLLAAGFIEPANGPWASRLVLVVKKDGTTRVCVDYRGLNDKTITDAYPAPVLDQAVEALAGNLWFSSLDAEKGYYQVRMSDRSKEITAFTCPFGLFQWTRMPFGLKTRQRIFRD